MIARARRRGGLPFLLALLLALPAALAADAGADPRASPTSTGHASSAARALLENARRSRVAPPTPRRAAPDRLDAFAARRRVEAAAEVRALRREGVRRMDRLHLERAAGPRAPASIGEVERARTRWRRDAAHDALQTDIDLDALERRSGRPLGPVTRRILRTRLRVRETRDAHEREAVGRALRDAADARAREAERGFLELPPRVPTPPDRR